LSFNKDQLTTQSSYEKYRNFYLDIISKKVLKNKRNTNMSFKDGIEIKTKWVVTGLRLLV